MTLTLTEIFLIARLNLCEIELEMTHMITYVVLIHEEPNHSDYNNPTFFTIFMFKSIFKNTLFSI